MTRMVTRTTTKRYSSASATKRCMGLLLLAEAFAKHDRLQMKRSLHDDRFSLGKAGNDFCLPFNRVAGFYLARLKLLFRLPNKNHVLPLHLLNCSGGDCDRLAAESRRKAYGGEHI